jgi:peptidoglycan/xylan/chitin deacetylase (PgdA/CDA1 family)/2-polyprenyl-3-methyl-5-hydroxy-6-metoxy-1,4-benzoquinol methylase
MADPVTVSVVIPARNASATLGETLASLQAQEFADWEAVIVDDGSVDQTVRVAREHVAREPRFRLIEGDGRGAAAARNRGIAVARGHWLHFLDADDWVAPSFMGRMVAALNRAEGAVAAQCAYHRVMPDGALTPASIRYEVSVDPFACFARTCAAAIHAVLVDRRLVTDLKGFDTGLQTCEDWDLWQRVARGGGRWITVDEPLAFYRTSSGSLTRNAVQMMRDCEVVVDRAFGADPPASEAASDCRRPDPADGTAAEAKAYFALWIVSCAIGACEDALSVDDHLSELPHRPEHINALAMTIFDGLMVGARVPPDRLADLWGRFGDRLCALINHLGVLWNEASAAFAVQLALEGLLLEYSPLRTTQQLGRTLGAPLDLSALAVPPLLADIEAVHLRVFDPGGNVGRLTLGVLGQPDQPMLARHLIRRISLPRTLRAQARGRAALSIGARASASLLRTLVAEPRAVRSRAGLRAAMVKAARRALVARAGPAATDSHDGTLNAMKRTARLEVAAMAVGQAQNGGGSGAPPEKVREGGRQAFWDDYFQVEDPWNYGSAYEQEKYARQLALLPDRPVGKALELACAEGHFSDLLAPRVAALLAVDISRKAIARAEARCERHANAAFAVLDLTGDPLPGGMDLITCSEVLYYLSDRDELAAVARRIARSLSPDGCLVTAHAFVLRDDMTRTGFDWDDPFGAETIANVFAATPGLALERSWQCDLYRIDRFRRLRDGEASPIPLIETGARETPLDMHVARHVVWGGAAVLRADVMRTERRERAPVLMYHSVAEDGPAALARYRISPGALQEQLAWLRKHGFHSLAPEQLALSLANPQPLPGRPVMITFDDGFQDFADAAWPLLQAHDFDADVFVVTDRLGETAIWDAAIAEPQPLMSEATVARLAAEGVRFGSHLATHRAINGLTTRDLAEELLRSSAKIGALTGKAPFALAAPFSIGDRRLGGLAADSGYGLAFAARSGCASLGDHPLDAPRIEVRGDMALDQFVATMEAVLR